MPIRYLPVRTLLVGALLLSPCLWAQAPAVAPAEEKPQTLEQAAQQRARAGQMRKDADNRYTADAAACYKKFLVNACLDDAKKAHTKTILEARRVDTPARDFQREAKRADAVAKDAQRAADAPRHAAEQQQQAEDYRAEEAAKAAEREKKKEAKDRQAEKGREKAAAEQARREAKQQQRARKDAERAAKKARADAKAQAKAAAAPAVAPN